MPIIATRVLAVVFALWWLFPGFGIIDLTEVLNPGLNVMLEVGWGLFFSVLVAVPFVAIALRPHRALSAAVQLTMASLALALAAVISLEWQALVLSGVVAGQALLCAIPKDRERLRRPLRAVHWPLLASVVVALPGWLVYGLTMSELNRQELTSADYTMGVDHYSVQAALAFALALLSLLCAVWPRVRIMAGLSSGVTAACLGIVSLGWPIARAAMSQPWSILVIVWAALFSVLAVTSNEPGRLGE